MDYIITMDGATGTIGERGTYDELVARDGPFSRFIAEFGGQQEEEEKKEEKEEDAIEDGDGKKDQKKKGPGAPAAALMQQEERETGAVKFSGANIANHVPVIGNRLMYPQFTSHTSALGMAMFLFPCFSCLWFSCKPRTS